METAIDPALLLKLERIRLAWDYTTKEMETHRSRYLQLFAAFLTGAAGAVATTLLERVNPWIAVAVTRVFLLGAGLAHLKLALLPSGMRRPLDRHMEKIESLMRELERSS